MESKQNLYLKCPYVTAQTILSGKWALLIVQALRNGPIRFNELQRQMPDITQTTLTRQLRSLENYDIITRKVYAQIPPKVEYELSPMGKSFMPVLDSLKTWGETYIIDKTGTLPQIPDSFMN